MLGIMSQFSFTFLLSICIKSCKMSKHLHNNIEQKISTYGYPFYENNTQSRTQEFTVEYYLSLGLPKDKMVLGIPVYGRCFTLDDIEENGFYAPAHKPGPAGPYIRIPGTLGLNEVGEHCLTLCEMFRAFSQVFFVLLVSHPCLVYFAEKTLWSTYSLQPTFC